MKILITLLSTLFITSAFAAVNPTAPTPTESQGSIDVQVQVGPLVQITNVGNDITIDQWTGGALNSSLEPQLTRKFCVFSNDIKTGYQYNISFSDTNK